jgi:hypothetical protein
MVTSNSATSYYVTVTGTGTDGSVKGKATAGGTNGVVAANAEDISTASTITPTITGSGSKVYIAAATGSSDIDGVKSMKPSIAK